MADIDPITPGDSAPLGRAPSRAPDRFKMWRRPTPSAEQLLDRKVRRWSELWETVVLAIATMITAWAGYEAGKWNGIQTSLNREATILSIDSARLTAEAQQLVLVDIGLFSDWINAIGNDNTRLADFYYARFRDEFRPAFDAWLETRPLERPNAPDSPFDMPDYRLSKREEAMARLTKAEQLIETGENAGAIGDQYTLLIVILAGALLLAGIANRFEWVELRAVVVVVALLVLLVSIVNIIRLPVV